MALAIHIIWANGFSDVFTWRINLFLNNSTKIWNRNQNIFLILTLDICRKRELKASFPHLTKHNSNVEWLSLPIFLCLVLHLFQKDLVFWAYTPTQNWSWDGLWWLIWVCWKQKRDQMLFHAALKLEWVVKLGWWICCKVDDKFRAESYPQFPSSNSWLLDSMILYPVSLWNLTCMSGTNWWIYLMILAQPSGSRDQHELKWERTWKGLIELCLWRMG